MILYVGNLPFSCTEQQVRSVFEQFGPVHSIKLVTDRDTGRKKGYGFIEMDPEDGARAIENLNQKEFGGRNLKVNEARQRD